MKPCRLKIITACINPMENESDKETIHYVSQNQKSMLEYNNTDINREEIMTMEEEKNIMTEVKNEDEEEEVIIRDKNDLKKKIIKINKEKVYLIDGLFSSIHNAHKNKLFQNQNKSMNNISNEKNKDNQKLRSVKNNGNISKNGKKQIYAYKWDPKFDNKVNTFYSSMNKKNSRSTSPNKLESEKIFSAPENPFAFNFYKTNKEIDSNITGLYDYKKKIKELIEQEPKKLEDRNNILKENKTKMEDLLKENTKLNYELGFEINREDELKGELIILKNKYEILFNQLAKEEIKIKQYQDIIKHKLTHEKIKANKKNEIINYYNNLNDCLTKGDVLLVTKPDLYNNFTYLNIKNIYNYKDNNNINDNDNNNNDINNNNDNKELDNNNINEKNKNDNNNKEKINKENNNNGNNNNNDKMNLKKNLEIIKELDYNNEINNYINYDIITLLFKGYFINMNLQKVDDIVNKIWINEKPLQTFETLTEELLLLIDNYINNPYYTFINEHNRNLIMNYFYSFCNCYNYMTKKEFISIFKDKLGHFIEFNENYLMSKLYKYCSGKLSAFMSVIKDLDKNKTGKIDIHEFIKALMDKNLIISNKYNENLNQISEEELLEHNDIIDIFQLLVIDMKKNVHFLEKNIENNEKTENNKDNNTERIEYNLKKANVNIYELYYNSIINIISDNSKSQMPLYKGIIKKYLIDKGMNSMMEFLEPFLLNNDIIIHRGFNRYIKSQTFINFLVSNNVIGEKETFLIPYKEETLIEINELVADIDQSKPLLNNFEENKEKFINDIINDISDS